VRVRLILGTIIGACLAALAWSQIPVFGQTGTRTSRGVQLTPARPRTAPPAAPRVSVPPVDPAAGAAAQRQLLDQYCVTCHNARLKTANLLLDQLDLTRLGEHVEVAEKVIRRVRAGLMPPSGVKRPEQASLDRLAAWMERAVDTSAPPHLPAPGLHRLNRTEYANAIRDLLSLEVDATRFLPPDDSTRGFDNIAGALTMSPALMEAYLSAAAASPSAATPRRRRRCSTCPPTRRRTITSKACRSAPAAACSSHMNFPPTGSTASPSRA
jgi:mono/diheme cytochrome c family protein